MGPYDKSTQMEPTKIAYINGRPSTLHLRRVQLVAPARVIARRREYVFDQDVITIGALEDNDLVLAMTPSAATTAASSRRTRTTCSSTSGRPTAPTSTACASARPT